MEKLIELFKETTLQNLNFETKFLELSDYLMNNFLININNKKFQIIECEIYHLNNYHPDEYTHKNKIQSQFCKWYIHEVGIDLTFGNPESYSSILVRGIYSLDEDKYFSGPILVRNKLLSNLNSFTEITPNKIVIEKDINIEKSTILSSYRIGLSDKCIDFKKRKYRFISRLNVYHKFKDKEKVIRENINNLRNYEEILGYKLKKNE